MKIGLSFCAFVFVIAGCASFNSSKDGLEDNYPMNPREPADMAENAPQMPASPSPEPAQAAAPVPAPVPELLEAPLTPQLKPARPVLGASQAPVHNPVHCDKDKRICFGDVVWAVIYPELATFNPEKMRVVAISENEQTYDVEKLPGVNYEDVSQRTQKMELTRLSADKIGVVAEKYCDPVSKYCIDQEVSACQTCGKSVVVGVGHNIVFVQTSDPNSPMRYWTPSDISPLPVNNLNPPTTATTPIAPLTATVPTRPAPAPPKPASPEDDIVPLPAKTYGYTWSHCERTDLDYSTIPFDRAGHFRPDCAPDTLYTWQAPGEINRLSAAAKKDPKNFLPIHYVYTWRTPLGTFGYQTAALRIKLKKGVKFQYVNADSRNCPINRAADQNTVYVTYLGNSNNLPGWTEYLLCSQGPIASWSHDTPEGLREMKAEKTWVQSHTGKEFDAIYRVGMGGSYDCNRCPLWKMAIEDPHTDWSNNRLSTDINNVEQKLKTEPLGEIFYAPGITPNRTEHFSTNRPGYFNPIAETP